MRPQPPRPWWIVLPLLLALPGHAPAQPLTLVADVRPGSGLVPTSSIPGPSFGFSSGPRLYFRNDHPVMASDIWSSDADPAATLPLFDSPLSQSSSPRAFGLIGARVLFSQAGRLYSTLPDGADLRSLAPSAAPSVQVEPSQVRHPWAVLPGPQGGPPIAIFPVLPNSFSQSLIASDGLTVTELLTGSRLPASGIFSSPQVVNFAGRAFFAVNQGPNALNAGLWSTQGTPETTLTVRSFPRAAGAATVDWLTPAPNLAVGPGRMLFAAPATVPSGSAPHALWITDGSAAGCTELKREDAIFGPGFDASALSIRWLTPIGSKVFFTVGALTNAVRLCESDGTPDGTRRSAFTPAIAFEGATFVTLLESSSAQPQLRALRGELVVMASPPAPLPARRLYIGDGTDAGMRQLLPDSASALSLLGPCGADPASQKLLFVARQANRTRIWVTDGSPLGTLPLDNTLDTVVDAPSSPRYLGLLDDGRAAFALLSLSGGSRRWVIYITDGTSPGARLLYDTALQPNSSNPSQLIEHNAAALFSSGAARFRTSGSPASTLPCQPVPTPSLGHAVQASISAGGLVYALTRRFELVDGVSQTVNELFAAPDCLGAAPLMRVDLGNFAFQGFASLGPTVFFAAQLPGSPSTSPFLLYRTQGTTESTFPLLADQPDRPELGAFARFRDRLLFWATPRGAVGVGPSLYLTDGTNPGTAPFFTLPPNSYVGPIRTGDTRAFFMLGLFNSNERQLWTTDGTLQGTFRIDPQFQLPVTTTPVSQFAALGDRVVAVRASQPAEGSEPYISNDALTTMSLLRDIAPAAGSSSPAAFTTFNSRFGPRVLFVATDAEHGAEPWITDGAPGEGTRLLRDIWPGTAGQSISSIFVAGDHAYFAAHDGTHGTELWRTDGLAATTEMISDLNPGPGSSLPAILGSAAGRLYVSAYRPDVGIEPFTVRLAPCPADANSDGELNPDDLSDFIACFFATPPCPAADFSADNQVDPDDLADFVAAYFTGC